MTPRQRFLATLDFQPVDRLPLMDFSYWDETIDAWREQGLPGNVITPRQVEDYFSLDRGYEYNVFHPDVNPRIFTQFYPPFERKVLKDEGDKVLVRDEEGVILREMKRMRSIPQYIRFPVETMEDYEALRWRLDGTDPKRYPDDWDQQVKQILTSGEPIGIGMAGFFQWPRELMGLENLALAYYDQPELVEIINRDRVQLIKDFCIRALQDLPVDYAVISEDMAYKSGCFISPRTFHRFITPYYEAVVDFLRRHGVRKILVDSDGDVRELVALFIEVGVDGIFPCERRAGSDPVELRRRYPGLALLGGVDKMALIAGPEAIDQELAHLAPVIAEGGYIPGVDHGVPPDVPLAHYRYFCERRREIVTNAPAVPVAQQ